MPEPVNDRAAYGESLAAFRQALRLPTVGASTGSDLDKLRDLIFMFPDAAEQFLAEAKAAKLPDEPAE